MAMTCCSRPACAFKKRCKNRTCQIWDKLAAFGCDLAQGYYISYPIPANNFSDWPDKSAWGLNPKKLVNHT